MSNDFAVERDDHRSRADPLGDAGEHGGFLAEVAHQDLLDDQIAAARLGSVAPEREADEERHGARASVQPGGLGVEVERASRRAGREGWIEREQREERGAGVAGRNHGGTPGAVRRREAQGADVQGPLRGIGGEERQVDGLDGRDGTWGRGPRQDRVNALTKVVERRGARGRRRGRPGGGGRSRDGRSVEALELAAEGHGADNGTSVQVEWPPERGSKACMLPQHLDTRQQIAAVRDALGRVMHGKAEVIDSLLVGVLGGGHVLIEDVPGVGKTTMAQALSRAFGVTFTRVQFTPDLLPTDILGSQVLHPRDGTFSFQRGPIFTNVLLADEINRASPRTQSALLEAMNEAQATIDGVDARAPAAVLRPRDAESRRLPGAPTHCPRRSSTGSSCASGWGRSGPVDDELAMIYARVQRDNPLARVEAVCTKEDLLALQAAVREVEVKEPVARYLLRIVRQTRDHEGIELGVSPRGALAFFRASQARALLRGEGLRAATEDVQAGRRRSRARGTGIGLTTQRAMAGRRARA